MVDEFRKYPWHRALIVAYQNPAFLGGTAQHRFVIHTMKPALSAVWKSMLGSRQRGVDNDPLEIVVGLEPNTHRRLASSSRAFAVGVEIRTALA